MTEAPYVLVVDFDRDAADAAREVLADSGYHVHAISSQPLDEAGYAALAPGAVAALVEVGFPMPAERVAMLERCKIITVLGVGFNNVDLEAAAARGIWVCNVPDYCIPEVSDHTIGLLVALSRRMWQLHRAVTQQGAWDFRLAGEVQRLSGQTLGIIGFGRIGRAVAPKAKALGLRVIADDPYIPPSIGQEYGVPLVSLEEVLGESDFVSLHVPLTQETYHLIGERELRMMKRSACLINTARGAVVDEAALVRALREGWIAGAGLDVLEEEPPAPDNPLFALDNVIITPHSAFYSTRANRERHLRGAREALRVLQGEPPLNPVNAPTLP